MKRLFKPKEAPAEPTANPYLNARKLWNEHTQTLLNATRMWQDIALASLMIALAAIGGVIHLAAQSKFIPYVVEVDKLGQTLAAGPAEKAAPADQRVIRASLAAFISNARLVTPDVALQRKAIFAVYAMLGADDPATAKMTAWLNGSEASNPFHRAARETVETEIVSVIQQTPETWQIEWNEKIFDRHGVPVGKPYHMQALATIAIRPPDDRTTEAQLRQNPLGVYVKDFSWAKQN